MMIRTLKPILPPFDKAEIMRYSGMKASTAETDALLEECLGESEGEIVGRVCCGEFDIRLLGNSLDLGYAKTDSTLLKSRLSGCGKTVLFAATVGLGIDRLISKYSRVSPAKALFFQSIGAERIEALCDTFEELIKEEYSLLGIKTVSRVSAGYGDIPLSMQKDIINALSCPKNIGVSLNESLLMSPSKSVTAIIGIKKSADKE